MRRVLRLLSAGLIFGAVMPIATATTVLAALILLPLPTVLPAAKPGVLASVTHVYDARLRLEPHDGERRHTWDQFADPGCDAIAARAQRRGKSLAFQPDALSEQSRSFGSTFNVKQRLRLSRPRARAVHAKGSLHLTVDKAYILEVT